MMPPLARIMADVVTLAEVLHANGYVAHAFLLLSWQSFFVTASSIGTSSSAQYTEPQVVLFFNKICIEIFMRHNRIPLASAC